MTAAATTTTMLDAALEAAGRGWAVLPLYSARPDGSCSCGKDHRGDLRSRAKHPITRNGLTDASTDRAVIEQWWKRHPDANVGIRTGRVSGIFVLDIDSDKGGDETLADLQLQNTALPDGPEVFTGGGGRHQVYRYPDGVEHIPTRNEHLGPGLDTKADGGYIVGPGSNHASGGTYRWRAGHGPDDLPIPDAPPWLLDKLVPRTRPQTTNGELRPVDLDDRRRALECLGQLNPSRADDRDEWLRVGMALHSVDAGDAMLDEWDRWSRQSGKYQPGEPREKWAGFNQHGNATGARTIGSLIATARKDERTEIIEHPDPMPLADHFLSRRYRGGDGELLLARWRGEFLRFTGSCFRAIPDEAIDAELYQHLDRCWTIKRDKDGQPTVDGNGKPKLRPIIPRVGLVREIRAAMPSLELLIDEHREPPLWIDGRAEPEPGGLIAFSNGLLDPASGTMYPTTPLLFGTHALPYPYRPDAPQPVEWLKFLDDLWPDDPEAINTLQEWAGYLLTPDTSQHKILLMVGPKRSGRGTIARVFTGMLGSVNVAAPTLGSLAQNFGLQSLLGKPLAIISDARLSGRTDQAIVVERLLGISGEDAVDVDRKHKPPLTVRLPTRFMLLTNELPRLADSSGALAGRFIVLKLDRSWYGREDHGLTDRLLTVLPGILNWALDGRERLQTRGYFVQPASSLDAIADLEDLGSPVGAFVRDCCRVGPGLSIECGTLYKNWGWYCEQNGWKHKGTSQTFSRDLKAAVPGVTTSQRRGDGGSRERAYLGIQHGL